jgi:hypothetical protein
MSKTYKDALPRNHTAERMRKQFGGKGGVMKSRNEPRKGCRNVQRTYLEEYENELNMKDKLFYLDPES